MNVAVISTATATLWQTLFAISATIASVMTGFGWLSRRIAKKTDIEKLSDELAKVKEGNTKENTRIISVVEELKENFIRTQNRLDRHVEFGTHARGIKPNPLDGVSDE